MKQAVYIYVFVPVWIWQLNTAEARHIHFAQKAEQKYIISE